MEAVQQAEELKQKAIADIESEKQKILSDLRLHVVNLTLTATERLVGETVDSEKNRKLVEEFIDKVEVPG
jgi:F-type H+-transporting ATPase subunit b